MKTKFILLILLVVCSSQYDVNAQNASGDNTEASLVNIVTVDNHSYADQLLIFNENKKQGYAVSSGTKKTIGWIFLGGGVALMGIGFASPKTESTLGSGFSYGREAIIGMGGLSALLSIPFFISASRDARYDATINFSTPRVNKMQENTLVSTQIPTLSVRVNL